MNLDELSRRLVKCKHFHWMDGMLAVSFQGDRRWVWRQNEQDDHLPESDSFPDLADPATLGCLLHLVREAWSEPSHTTRAWQGSSGDLLWHMALAKSVTAGMLGVFLQGYATEAEALVAALEAAP